jgi:hypothetical protein
MAKFNFAAFEAVNNKMKAQEQAQADAQGAEQAAIVAQPDPNIAPVQQAAPAATQGFNIDDFLGREPESTSVGVSPVGDPGTLELAAQAVQDVGPAKTPAQLKAGAESRTQEQLEKQEERAGQEEFVGKAKAVSKFVGQEGPQLALSTAGGILGGIPGAAVGGALGRAISDIGMATIDAEGTGELPEDIIMEIGKNAAGAGIEEGLWDLGGGVVTKVGGFVASPILKKIAPKAAAFADMFRQAGGKFSPAELDRRALIQFLEAGSRNSLGGREIFEKFVNAPSDKALTKMHKIIGRDLAEGVGKLSPDLVADSLAGSIKGIDSSFDETLGPAWTQLNELTEGATVSTKGLKEFAEKELLELEEINAIGGSAELGSMLSKVDGLEDFVGFKGMRRIKRDLIRQVKSLNISGDVADGVAKKLAGLAEGALLDPASVKGASKEAKLLHQNLKAAYRTGKTAFNEAFPRKIIDDLVDPRKKAAVVERMFPDQSVDNIKNIKNTLTKTLKGTVNKEGTKTWNKLQRLWYEDLITRSTDASGVLSSAALEENIQKFGASATKEILGADSAKNLRLVRGIAEAKQVQRTNMRFLVGSIQLGGAGTVAAGLAGDNDLVTIGSGGAIVLSPAIFALMSGSRGGSALLRAGLRMPKGSKSLPKIVLKMNAAIRRERKKQQE